MVFCSLSNPGLCHLPTLKIEVVGCRSLMTPSCRSQAKINWKGRQQEGHLAVKSFMSRCELMPATHVSSRQIGKCQRRGGGELLLLATSLKWEQSPRDDEGEDD